MAFPFQKLVARGDNTKDWTLFGASGTKLFAQSGNGSTSVWPTENESVRYKHNDEEERPGKRVKLSPATPTQKSTFSHLVLSTDGQYLVAVTGEDKCIRVFSVENGLKQLSERCMPRRPSSIVLTSDDSTILCADKFGDVYALPLLPGLEDEIVPPPPAVEEPTPEPQQDYTPAATVYTVHSGRNRKTLEDQLKQKAKAKKTKEVAAFKHDLLLGHVSMLTDLAYAKVDNRSYIITADRDEHIRISRGQPQAHVIEGFCFGHEQFVSRLCLTASNLLVSGGGDSDLYVWDWQNYTLQNVIPLREHVLAHVQARPDLSSVIADAASFKIAVSGIWQVPSHDSSLKQIIAACEGIPALFAVDIDSSGTCTALPLRGNVLHVASVQMDDSWTLIVSIDNVYKPGSTTELQDDHNIPRLQYFSNQIDGQLREDDRMSAKLEWFAQQGSEIPDVKKGDAKDTKAVRDILYGVENLRKRPGADVED